MEKEYKNKNTKFFVKIKYCINHNYEPHYINTNEKIKHFFHEAIVDGVKADEKTDEFEIFVNGQLIHSKLKGQGFPDFEHLMNHIDNAL